jgi:mono/diheme cytochrome c family protein
MNAAPAPKPRKYRGRAPLGLSRPLTLAALALIALFACRKHPPAGDGSPHRPAPAQAPSIPAAAVASGHELTVPALPRLLSQTGLYLPGRPLKVDPKNVRYEPRYALWTDGARKTRYIRLPEGTTVDARDPNHLRFPIGTRFWKEFAFGSFTETRYIERLADGSFRFATYLSNTTGTDAELVPREGKRDAGEIANGVFHDLPSEDECRACHDGRPTPVLGFTALQLATDADELERRSEPEGAPDLGEFVGRGLISNLPAALVSEPPRIAAPSARAREALGYLYANCSHCHNAEGPLAPLGLDFDLPLAKGEARPRLVESALGKPSRFQHPNGATLRIAAGRPEESIVLLRMRTRDGITQMPPLGTKLTDRAAVDLVSRFIARDLPTLPQNPGGSS